MSAHEKQTGKKRNPITTDFGVFYPPGTSWRRYLHSTPSRYATNCAPKAMKKENRAVHSAEEMAEGVEQNLEGLGLLSRLGKSATAV
ncbi:MAG: hypothetical protein M3329_07650 [Pseudomonadota bacterium]|nr:hypothetical protein [Pseudomonadota bacterium]